MGFVICVYSFMSLVVITAVSSQFIGPFFKGGRRDSVDNLLDLKHMLKKQKNLPVSNLETSRFEGAKFRSKLNKILKFIELGLKESVEKYIHQGTINSIDVIRVFLDLQEELKDWRSLNL